MSSSSKKLEIKPASAVKVSEMKQQRLSTSFKRKEPTPNPEELAPYNRGIENIPKKMVKLNNDLHLNPQDLKKMRVYDVPNQNVNQKSQIDPLNNKKKNSIESKNEDQSILLKNDKQKNDFQEKSEELKKNDVKKDEKSDSDDEKEETNEMNRIKYLADYEFLEFDKVTKLLYCKWCRDKGHINSLAKGYIFLKKHRITEHCNGSEHRVCLKEQNVLNGKKPSENQQTLEESLNCTKKNEDVSNLIPVFRNVYFLAKENIALHKSSQLHQLNELNGANLSNYYRNEVTARLLMVHIAEVFRKEILENLSKSPYIGVQLDESPDINLTPHLSMCFQYLDKNGVHSKFLRLFELDNQKAETIFNILWAFLCRHQLHKKCIAMSVDGCPTMLSHINGVYGRLKQKIPGLLVNHCALHRLALTVKGLMKPIYLKKNQTLASLTDHEKDEYLMHLELSKFYQNVKELISFLTGSANRINALDKNTLLLNKKTLKLVSPTEVRFLSFYQCLVRLLEIYPAILKTLDEFVNNDNADKEISDRALTHLNVVTQFRFIFTICYLGDIMRIINRPEVSLQKNVITLNKYLQEINLCISELSDLYDEDDKGLYLKKFLTEFDKTKKEFKEFLFEYMKDEEVDGLVKARKVTNKIRNDIVARFSVDNPMLKNFSTLEIPTLKANLTKDNSKLYGNRELVECSKHINSFVTSHVDYSERDETIDLDVIVAEWKTFKNNIMTNYTGASSETLALILTESDNYSTLIKIYDFMSVIPLTSVECERTFSTMNLIMTSNRNCLENDTLEDLILISVYGPDDLENFDPIPSIRLWQSTGKRKFN